MTSLLQILSPRAVVRLHCIALAVLLALAATSPPVAARVLPDLYEVTVAIDSQSSAELRRASREALAELFVRISGHRAVLDNDTIVAAVRDASRFTRQFSYQSETDEDGEQQLRVVLDFESSLVEDTLRRAGLPLWSSNRPTVLVWLVADDEHGRHFVGGDQAPELVAAIREQAIRRGLAVQLPALDLEDLVALSPDDIWRQNFTRIDEAAERYGADSLLVGRVSQLNNGRWLGRWSFRLNGQRIPFEGEAADGKGFIVAGLNQVAETLAGEYAIAPVQAAEGGVLMRLTDVRSFVDYARAIQYLEGIVAVHHANVVSLQRDELILRLIADGEIAQLQQVFSLDKRLQPQLQQDYTGPYPIVLSYRWPSAAPPLPPPPQRAAEPELQESVSPLDAEIEQQ